MDKKHIKCLLWKSLWGLSILLFIATWIVAQNSTVVGVDPIALFGSALFLVVASIPIKLDCHSCGVCGA